MPKRTNYTKKNEKRYTFVNETQNDRYYKNLNNCSSGGFDGIYRKSTYYQVNEIPEEVILVVRDEYNANADTDYYKIYNKNDIRLYPSDQNIHYKGHNPCADKMNYFFTQQYYNDSDDYTDDEDDSVVYKTMSILSLEAKKKHSKSYIVEEPPSDNDPEDCKKSKEYDAPISNICVVEDLASIIRKRNKNRFKTFNIRSAFE